MKQVSAAYKDARKPLIYEVNLSIDRGATWMDIPADSKVILPFGTAPQRCEDPQPFDYVGPDMGLTALNNSGYWTNPTGTGMLDLSSGEVWLRVRTGNSGSPGEWLTHIQGPIDPGSVQPQAGDLVTFTLRGTLNSLDSVFAMSALNQRGFAYRGVSNGVLVDVGGFPNKFKDWMKVSILGCQEGLYCLRWDSQKKTVSFANGPAVKLTLDNQTNAVLTGANGETISVMHGPMNDDIHDDYASEDIEAWVRVYYLIETGGPGHQRNLWVMQDARPVASLADFKSKIAGNINLDIDEILSNGTPLTTILPDVVVAHMADQDEYYPAACCGIGPGRWLISSHDGVRKGTWLIETVDNPFRLLDITKIFDDVAFAMQKIGNKVVLFTDSSTDKNDFISKSFIENWIVIETTIGTWGRTVKYTSTDKRIAWRSMQAYTATEWYAVTFCASDTGYITRYLDSGALNVGIAFPVNGPSLFPGAVIDTGANTLYVAFSAEYNVTNPDVKVEIYAKIWNIGTAAFHSALLNIAENQQVKFTLNYTSRPISSLYQNIRPLSNPTIRVISSVSHINTIIGPAMCCAAKVATGGTSSLSPASAVLMLDCIQHIQPDTEWMNARRIAGGGRVFTIDFSVNTGSVMTVITKDFTPQYPNMFTDKCYTALINVNVVGSTLTVMTGPNAGVSRTITAQEVIQTILPTYRFTKLSFSAFTYPIFNNVTLRIGTSGVTTDKVITTELQDKNGAELLDKNVGVKDFEIFNSRSLSASIDRNISYGELAPNRALGRPWCADLDTDTVDNLEVNNRLMLCSRSAITFVKYGASDIQIPYVAINDFGNKTLREAIQEVSTNWNLRILPREGDKKLILQRRAYISEAAFNILLTQYEYAGQWQSFGQYSLVVVNGISVGSLVADRFGRTLSINCAQIHPSQRTTLAKDIFDSIGSGRRTHNIRTDWLVWIEPGDVGYLEVRVGGTTHTVKVFCLAAEPDLDSKKHNLLLIETPTIAGEDIP